MADDKLTEAEFDKWLSVSEALELAPTDDWRVARRWVMSRLKTGAFVAVARWAGKDGDDLKPFVLVNKARWATCTDDGDYDLWASGDAVFHNYAAGGYSGSTTTTRFLTIKIEPDSEGLKGRRPEAVPAVVPPKPTKALGSAEYENVARAIAAGWGKTINEEDALALAKRIFPDHNVSRAPFLAQYRRERGPKTTGKPTLRH